MIALESRDQVRARLAETNRRVAAFGLSLKPFQAADAEWLATRWAGANLNPMGLGKTIESIMAFRPGAPVLVCCPSVVKRNWAREIRLWRPEFAIAVIESRRDFRWPRPGEVVIVNYEILPPSKYEIDVLDEEIKSIGGASLRPAKYQELLKLRRLRAMLRMPHEGTEMWADEAHRLKSTEAMVTRRWRELAVVCQGAKGRVFIVTGTPLMNAEEELWTTLQAAGLGVDAWGELGEFLKAWHLPGGVVEGLRKVSIRRRREDCIKDLPPKTRETLVVPLTAEARRLSDDFVASLKVAGVNLETATLEAIASATMQKIPREQVAALRKALATAKLPRVTEFVEDHESSACPLVVFSSHRAPLDVLAVRKGWGRISGAESSEEKDAIAQRFQSGEIPHGVACATLAAGSGVTLHRAWKTLFVDKPWNPAALNQAEARIDRIGQKASGLVYVRMICDHVLERRLEDLLLRKQETFDASVEASSMVTEGAAT